MTKITIHYEAPEPLVCDSSEYREEKHGIVVTRGRFMTFIPTHSIRYIVIEKELEEVK